MLKCFISALAFFLMILSLNAQEKITVTGGNIRLRSAPSVTTEQPLVIVDNFVTDMKSMLLNPGAIQSITVLKDASATALYGSKGTNGVILIKTKPGTEFYTIADFVNAERNPSVQKVKLNETVLLDMKKLLVDKKAFKQTMVSSVFSLDENCKAVRNDMLVVMTNAGN